MKLQKIKLNKLAENSLANREMKELKGEKYCTCGCNYENNECSSTDANGYKIYCCGDIYLD